MGELRLFDQNQYSKSSRVERIYMHILQPGKYALTPNEEIYHRRLIRAFTILSEHTMVYMNAVKFIKDLEKVSKAQAMTIVTDAEDLYGRIRKINKETQRVLLYDKATYQMERALKLNKPDLAEKFMKVMIKVSKMDQEDINDFDIADLVLLQPIYTNDPSALLDAEDAEVEWDEEE